MKSKLDMVLLMLILLLSMATEAPATSRRGGEILWQRGRSTLYRCGPAHEDLCFDDSYRVTKIHVGD